MKGAAGSMKMASKEAGFLGGGGFWVTAGKGFNEPKSLLFPRKSQKPFWLFYQKGYNCWEGIWILIFGRIFL